MGLISVSHHIKSLLKENLVFFVPGFLFWSVGAFFLLISSKSAIHLWFDAHHFLVADLFFKYITYLGDGVFISSLILLMYVFKYRYEAKVLFFSYLTSTILVQIIKATLPHNNRPYLYFYGKSLQVVEGVPLLAGSSFPSGHSAGAFCLFFLAASFTPSNAVKSFFGLMAVVVCLSRIYLNQHFLADTIAGGIIAIGITVVVMAIFKYRKINHSSGKVDTFYEL